MRRAARVDSNHMTIIKGLRNVGCSVVDLSRVGQGCPDIGVGFGGITLLFEIKDGEKPPSARKLTKDEKKWHENWKGHIAVVTSLGDAIEQVKLLTKNIKKVKE